MQSLFETPGRFISANACRAICRVLKLLAALGFALAPASQAAIDFTYNSANDIPVSASSYTASGTATLALNFAPTTGTNLTLINNTGLGFISGTFSNLTQGQEVALSHGGTNYVFWTNYYGGTGNDLVLMWANVRPVAWGENSNGQLGNDSASNSYTPAKVIQSGALAGKRVIAVSTGYHHSLALCSDGTLAAWGANWYGELGNGTTTSSLVPVAVYDGGVLAGKKVIAIAAGSYHSLALCSDGTVSAWGSNSYDNAGQLGNNSTTNSLVPVMVDRTGALSGKTVVSIAAGKYHSVALCSDGTLASWGHNLAGQLGNGTFSNSLVPVTVNNSGVLAGKTVIAVSAGGGHCLAKCSDGTLVGWGDNYYGQLGNNERFNKKSVPVQVFQGGILSGKTVLALSTANSHSLALCSDGTLAAWGANFYGKLGDNTTTDRSIPVAVVRSGALAGKNVISISTGDYHSLALCSDGTRVAWGNNFYGQFGNGGTSQSLVPVAASSDGLLPGERFVLMNSGPESRHSLGVVASRSLPPVVKTLASKDVSSNRATLIGTVNANNSNSLASFDYGLTAEYGNRVTAAPAPIAGGSPITVTANLAGLEPGATYHFRTNGANAVGESLGEDHAFITQGTVTFKSANDVLATSHGFSAFGTLDIKLGFTPPAGTNLVVANITGPGFVDGSFDNLKQGEKVMLRYGGLPYWFEVNYFGGTGNDLVLEWPNVRPVAWSRNKDGQLGNNSTVQSNVPVSVNTSGVLAGKRIVAFAEGAAHSLAVCSDGTLAAWGSNTFGELGNNSKTASRVPVAVDRSGALAGKKVISLAAGNGHSLALCSDGTVAAWGSGIYGQLGNGSTSNRTSPTAVYRDGLLAGKTVTAISSGIYFSMALCSDGTLAAWGENFWGTLGNGGTSNQLVPSAVVQSGVLADKTVTAISAGSFHCLVLCSDGSMATWGYNPYGQLGNNSTVNSKVPVSVSRNDVLADRKVVEISSGGNHCLALCSDGKLVSWGSNNNGELGNIPVSISSEPIVVEQTGVLAGKNIKNISGKYTFSRVLCTDGTLASWGSNTQGELGNNSTISSKSPVVVYSSDLVPGERIVLTKGRCASIHTLALVASPQPAPDSITLISGSSQRAELNTPFGSPLVAIVKDKNNQPMSDVSVTFNAPDSAATATFGGNSSITIITDANGIANSGIVTASGMNGSYLVTATAPLVSTPASFYLMNGSEYPKATMPPTPVGGFSATKQTGLFDIIVSVRNTTPFPINGFRLHVDLSSYLSVYPSLRLYNASSPAGSPDVYVDYPYPVALDGVISMKLSFYTSTRTFPNPFAPGLSVEILKASQLPDTNGSGVQPRVVVMQDGAILLEFPSVPGRWYRVRYSSDMVMWSDCPVPLQASGTRMQWIDSGPPFTNVPPSSVPSRFYVVNEILAP